MYNSDVVIVKQMILTIERIREYTSEFDNPDDFASDYKTFDATLMNFVALGEMVGKLSFEFRDLHHHIEWSKIYAFRNIIAHDYFGVDEEEVFGIIQKHIPILHEHLQNLINR